MPKIGMEPIRRAALVEATIAEIGAAGSLDVTVSKIAKRAGMSSALAHHYFGGKEQIFVAAMRYTMGVYAAEVQVSGIRDGGNPAVLATADFIHAGDAAFLVAVFTNDLALLGIPDHHGAVEIARLGKVARRTKQHRRVTVVTTCVHLSLVR